MTDVMDELERPAAAGSLRDRVQQRRRELEQAPDVAIILPLPGYEDMLSVQYRPLDFREMLRLEGRHEKNPDEAEKTVLTAADKLIAACERIVENCSADEYEDTGYRWNAAAARDLFGCDLPDGAKAREGVLAVFNSRENGEEDLARHLMAYEEQRQALRSRVDGRVEGESEASSARS